VWEPGPKGYGEPREANGDATLDLTHPFPSSLTASALTR
jgi:hypothetical protein